MIEIAHSPRCGPLVEVTLIRWNKALSVDDVEELLRPLSDSEVLLPAARLHELEEELNDRENELADEKARWRKRCSGLIALARKMIDRERDRARKSDFERAFDWK